jgi:hypothetical protein
MESSQRVRVMNKDMLDALADALLGSGSARVPEPSQKWFVCISDGKGSYNQHETTNLYQAQVTVRDWNATGWPAWIQDDEGNVVVFTVKPKGIN